MIIKNHGAVSRFREDGVASFEAVYDDRGNVVKHSYFGTDGKPIMNVGGYASVEYVYEEDALVKKLYYDADGKLIGVR